MWDESEKKGGGSLRLYHRALEETMREKFSQFLRRCFMMLNPGTEYLHNWHIDLISEYLQACRRREIRRLIINVPPRSLKSIAVSVAWPAFLLGHNPALRIMAASYAAGLSVKHSVDRRNVVQSAWYRNVFPDMELSQEQNEKHKFLTTRFGHRIATSVGGTATGEGGDFLIVDDPQNPALVAGEATRRVAAQWFDHTFSSRLDNKREGVIVVVMQRLHAQDLTGHLLEKGGWEHLRIPAIADRRLVYEMGDMRVVRGEGDILHPAREDAAIIKQAQRELGSMAFAAQYQQEPVPESGEMMRREWLRYYAAVPEQFERVVQSWDTAIKAGAEHDASVCLTVGESEGRSYLLDIAVLRAEYPELRRAVLRMAERYVPDIILMEDKASGQSLLQDMRRQHPALPMVAVCPVADKITRFAAVSAMIEAGRVWLPREAAWLSGFEREILGFPAGKHDDQVDALTQYLGWLRGRVAARPRIRQL